MSLDEQNKQSTRARGWAACGAQLWNELSPSKKDKMADGLPKCPS